MVCSCVCVWDGAGGQGTCLGAGRGFSEAGDCAMGMERMGGENDGWFTAWDGRMVREVG